MAASMFLHYDREGLDREYDKRRKVAGSAEHLVRYAAQLADPRGNLKGAILRQMALHGSPSA